ncbi:MAG: relaxase/mobilization nuclease domain-containing protein [Clostridia bacterium]|nr:relaxase/mobilization nuclease domain-containing protein [Clostridia bacterium]
MAVIKIKTIKSNLQAVINYGKNGDKTDNGVLVSSANCSVDTAYEEMALTKKFFHKEDKTLGYHIIQSFKGNEVSPERANQIGKELVENVKCFWFFYNTNQINCGRISFIIHFPFSSRSFKLYGEFRKATVKIKRRTRNFVEKA